MWLKDKDGMKYQAVKKDGNYYLITNFLDRYTEKRKVRVEVKGKENILTFIKNNGLVKVEEVEKMKLGLYTEDEIYEELAKGFLQRSMVDAVFDKLHSLITENEQLKKDKKELEKRLDILNEIGMLRGE